MMKKILLLLIIFNFQFSPWFLSLSKGNLFAYDYDYAGCYRSVKLSYLSIDENNSPIILSEIVTFPLEKDGQTNRKVGFFVLSSMPYSENQTSKYSTSNEPLDALILRTIATEGAIAVQLDGQGCGDSDGHIIPYCVNKLTGRQAVDGLLAAMDYAERQGISVSSDYYTINAGYSLAGGVAIATQRYLEKYSSDEVKKRIRLRKTICGGAPLDMTVMAESIIDNASKNGGYDWRMKLIKGCMSAYKNSTMNAVDLDDIFLKGDTLDIDRLKDHKSSGASRAFWKVASLEEMEQGWLPETPITMVFRPDDETVPYRNAELALQAWGNEKLRIIDKDMTGMKWNVSMLRPVREAVNNFAKLDAHTQGLVDFYSGMIDGCLRDTLIASTYGKTVNFQDMLTTAFDLGRGLTTEIPVNISTTVSNGTLTIKTIGNMHFTGVVCDLNGDVAADIDVTIKPEVKNELNSKITKVDATGYLLLPLEFKVVMKDFLKTFIGNADMTITGSCQDAYKLAEQISAILLHRTCPTPEIAQRYCDAINSNLSAEADILTFSGSLFFGYTENSEGCTIEPYFRYKYLLFWHTDRLESFLQDKASIDISPYLTLDNQKITVSDYNVMFHVTERNFGEVKLYADILSADSSVIGKVDLDVTPVDMNSDGTEETFNISFVANAYKYHAQVVGRCHNLNDAILAGIICYGNLSCETEDKAQAYATAVNNNVQAEFYVMKVGDDGNYPEEPTESDYMDYGNVHASVAQDEHGAWYVQYCLHWMNEKDIPLMTIFKSL